MPNHALRFRATWILFACVSACQGTIGERELDMPPAPPPIAEGEVGVVEGGGFTRLSVRELERTLDALFPALTGQRQHFSSESFGRFDTDRDEARIGAAFMDSAFAVAESTATAALADASLRAQLLACDESDEVRCLEAFLVEWPPRILQRALTNGERADYDALASADLGGAEAVVSAALTALLVHPEFLFRVAVGNTDAPLRELQDHEILMRLSLFLWGHAPDETLRSRTTGLDLNDAASRIELADWMVDDPRAAEQRSAFHAQWLGYSQLSREGLGGSMWNESDALVERATAEGADYRELFLSGETFVNADLAEHYGLPAPAGRAWVSYGATPRRGILAHASFLSAYTAQGQGSPTKRGKAVLNRLLCLDIELPDDMDINTDDGPGPDQCRKDFLETVHSSGSCASCHSILDGIGFGLEIFDASGVQIEHEQDKAHCGLDGEGQFEGATFVGASGLAEAIVESSRHDACLVEQLLHFQIGTDPSGSGVGAANVAALTEHYVASGRSYRALVREIVGSEAFAQVNLP